MPYRRRGKSFTRTTQPTPARPFRLVNRRTQRPRTTRRTTTTRRPVRTTTTTTTATTTTTTTQAPTSPTTTGRVTEGFNYPEDYNYDLPAVPIQILGSIDETEPEQPVEEEEVFERQPTRGERFESTELPLPVHKEVAEEKKEGLDIGLLKFYPAYSGDENENDNETDSNIGRGLIIVNPDSNETDIPRDVHPSFKGHLPRYPGLFDRIDSDVFLFHDPITEAPQPSTATPSTPSPTTSESDVTGSHFTADPESTLAPETTSAKPVEAATEGERLSISDLEWFVVDDPRAGRHKAPPVEDGPTPLPNSEIISTTNRYTTPNLPEADPGSLYSLPDINGETMLIEIPEDYSLSDFEWFGVYDHCRDTRTAFVSLKDIRPPAEAVLPDGIKGWQYDTASSEITVLNCNTIRLDGFTFKGHNYTNTYIYVGTGEFPDFIQQHVRAAVIGQREDEPLRDYNNEDVLVKLPEGWKTFDIDFVSIFNPAERTSYGHAVIPPVVVPPCEDVFAFSP